MTISALNTKTYAPFNFFLIFDKHTIHIYLSIYHVDIYIYMYIHPTSCLGYLFFITISSV